MERLTWHSREEVSVAQKNREKAQESIGGITHQTGKNLHSDIKPVPKWQKGSLITSQSHSSNWRKQNHNS
jgi:hypothetical protein